MIRKWILAITFLLFPFLIILIIQTVNYLVIVNTPFPQTTHEPEIPDPENLFPLLKQSIQEQDLELFVSLLSEDILNHYEDSYIQNRFAQLCTRAGPYIESSQLSTLVELESEINGKSAYEMVISFEVPIFGQQRESILLMLENNVWKACYPSSLFQSTGPQTSMVANQE